jgi:hypothetical protein
MIAVVASVAHVVLTALVASSIRQRANVKKQLCVLPNQFKCRHTTETENVRFLLRCMGYEGQDEKATHTLLIWLVISVM